MNASEQQYLHDAALERHAVNPAATGMIPDAPDFDALVYSEADALIAGVDVAGAIDLADNWEALLEERWRIIYYACRLMNSKIGDSLINRATLGGLVMDLVTAAIMKRASHELEQLGV